MTVSISQHTHIPPLPHRHPVLGVIYPTGIFRGVYWYEELLTLITLQQGHIVCIHQILYAHYETFTCAPVMQKLLDLRYEGNIFAKRIINSMYGRLALEPSQVKTEFFLLNSDRPLPSYATNLVL